MKQATWTIVGFFKIYHYILLAMYCNCHVSVAFPSSINTSIRHPARLNNWRWKNDDGRNVEAVYPRHRLHAKPINNKSAEQQSKRNTMSGSNNPKWQDSSYNDDAFGFVFLGSFFLTQDVVFGTLFVIISAMAAIGTLQGTFPGNSKRIPANVAGITVLLRLVVFFLGSQASSSFVVPIINMSVDAVPISTIGIETGLCLVSILYGYIISSSSEEEDIVP